ncbi:helix-turn-helix transcriptional regulator [Clostridium sp.]|uniref:helix-turn-helix domain-containing protein n=1 Tax=Clostridium sp. TaxID=1506 RepID=UPI001A3C7977|nr:helix-turn-helix transcriptional regulator [Clostridium sp.]MBK5242430.1 helix-turn-helix transcriptional regulator [Clostridium sp.]
MIKETISNRIREKRKSKKITQKELSKMLNKAESTIQKYESGEIEVPNSVLEEIAKALDTTVLYLLGYEEAQKKLDEIRLFKEQLNLLGCYFKEFICSKECIPDTNVTGCTFINGVEMNCSSCDIKQSCYILSYNNSTIRLPISAFDNLRENFKSYIQFMLLELIKKNQ